MTKINKFRNISGIFETRERIALAGQSSPHSVQSNLRRNDLTTMVSWVFFIFYFHFHSHTAYSDTVSFLCSSSEPMYMFNSSASLPMLDTVSTTQIYRPFSFVDRNMCLNSLPDRKAQKWKLHESTFCHLKSQNGGRNIRKFRFPTFQDWQCFDRSSPKNLRRNVILLLTNCWNPEYLENSISSHSKTTSNAEKMSTKPSFSTWTARIFAKEKCIAVVHHLKSAQNWVKPHRKLVQKQ